MDDFQHTVHVVRSRDLTQLIAIAIEMSVLLVKHKHSFSDSILFNSILLFFNSLIEQLVANY